MKSIVYTPEVNISNEIERIVELFEVGVDYLYLRKPSVDIAYWYAYIEQLPYGYENKIVTTDFRLLHELKLGGFHFQQEMIRGLSESDLKENLTMLHMNSKISSATAHNFEELKKYDGLFKHVLISPLFDSISKSGYTSAWNVEELRDYIKGRKKNGTLLFAQGGIDDTKIDFVQILGLDGITLLGYLWSQPEKALEQYKKLHLQ